MRSRSFRNTLRSMYSRRDAAPEPPQELEADVMTRYEALYSHGRSWIGLLNPHNRIARYALGSLGVLALTGVACEMPTSTPVELGQHVTMQFAPAEDAPAEDAPAQVSLQIEVEVVQSGDGAEATPLREMPFEGRQIFEPELQSALAAAGADKIEFRMRRVDGRPSGMDVFVWGQHIAPGDIERLIEQYVGEERILSYDIQPLTGTVSETLGKRIGRRLFDIEVGGETAEQLRASILAQLAEQGFDGDAVVDVQDDGGVRKITVEAGTSDGSRKVANEVIIERPEN